MTAPTSGPADEFQRLRLAYDDAFRDFTAQVRLFQAILGVPEARQDEIRSAQQRLAQSAALYRLRRDSLAEYLLGHRPPAVL